MWRRPGKTKRGANENRIVYKTSANTGRHIESNATASALAFPFSGKTAVSTQESSQAVFHPSFNRALRRVTSEVRRDPASSAWPVNLLPRTVASQELLWPTKPAILKGRGDLAPPMWYGHEKQFFATCAPRRIRSIFLSFAQFCHYHLLPLPLRLPLPLPLSSSSSSSCSTSSSSSSSSVSFLLETPPPTV